MCITESRQACKEQEGLTMARGEGGADGLQSGGTDGGGGHGNIKLACKVTTARQCLHEVAVGCDVDHGSVLFPTTNAATLTSDVSTSSNTALLSSSSTYQQKTQIIMLPLH